MSSFYPFSSASPPTDSLLDDAHLEVTVTPSASAFYAGEVFSAKIAFRNTRTEAHKITPSSSNLALSPLPSANASATRQIPAEAYGGRDEVDQTLPRRQGQIGSQISANAEAGPSKMRLSPKPRYPGGFPYSPGADPSFRAGWPKLPPTIRSPEQFSNGDPAHPGHSRRARSLGLGKGHLSPQQMVWALSGQQGTPPPLPRRHSGHHQIPASNPHSRKNSLTSLPATSPNAGPSPLPDLDTVPEAPNTAPVNDARRAVSGPASASAYNTTSSEQNLLLSPIPLHPKSPKLKNDNVINLTPSPPVHPYTRSHQPRITTILWAYTRLKASFHPSNTYIPPDPLLPLRSLMLHQPIGSGSLNTTEGESGSRWQMSFGTGTIGNSTQPSLTGSLFGLAKGLVSGGSGSLEEERRRVWNMKELPVLESNRSLIGVDLRLKEGEVREYTYTLKLPSTLPPTHRGRAFRFNYDMVMSLNVALPGGGKRQKSKEIFVPIRVWANVSVPRPMPTYDVLNPSIHNDGQVIEQSQRPGIKQSEFPVDDRASLSSYAEHLLDNLQPNGGSGEQMPRSAPLSPSRPSPKIALSPSAMNADLPSNNLTVPEYNTNRLSSDGPNDLLAVPGPSRPSTQRRRSSLIEGDEELAQEAHVEGDSGEAVEILSRHSPKASFDIAKDGDMVAVLTLIKSTFRLGESVSGVVAFNGSNSRRVLKFSAFLESEEIIPEALLPSTKPDLTRLHAEYRTGYTINTSRLSFALDIPSDATPAFSLSAGEGGKGGLEWKIKLAFLVTAPKLRHHRHSLDRSGSTRPNGADDGDRSYHYLLPQSKRDKDNQISTASTSLSPAVLEVAADGIHSRWHEMSTEVVECDIPIRVLAGNTAFIVRPTIQVI